jgi:hypothetical protein
MSTRVTLLVVALAVTAARRDAQALPTAEVAVRSEPAALMRSLVPGLGQLDRGDRVKGWAVLITEGALLASALGFQLAADAARRGAAADFYAAPARNGAFAAGQHLSEAAAERARFRDGFLVATAGVWALSFVDAYLARSHATATVASATSPALDELAIGERMLLPIASITRGGFVAGLSLRF